jgi:hypothetical protein
MLSMNKRLWEKLIMPIFFMSFSLYIEADNNYIITIVRFSDLCLYVILTSTNSDYDKFIRYEI